MAQELFDPKGSVIWGDDFRAYRLQFYPETSESQGLASG